MQFHLLTRKGNKPQTTAVEVPAESQLALQRIQAKEQERQKQLQLKALTLKLDEMERAAVRADNSSNPQTFAECLQPPPPISRGLLDFPFLFFGSFILSSHSLTANRETKRSMLVRGLTSRHNEASTIPTMLVRPQPAPPQKTTRWL